MRRRHNRPAMPRRPVLPRLSPADTSRRATLRQLSLGAAAWALQSLFAAPANADTPLAGWPGGAYPFTLGVASGQPRPDSVVLWTRLAPRPREARGGLPQRPIAVRWELAADPLFTRVVREGLSVAQPEHAHSVHIEPTGLPSGSEFFYRFVAGGHASPVGRTRTAPAPDADVPRLRFALASCQHYEQGRYALHREIAQRNLDFVLFVGDYIYETSKPRYQLRAHWLDVPWTLDEYRVHHAQYKTDADLRAMHAAHPWIVTLDDHDVENDYAGNHSGFEQPEHLFLQRRANAFKAYFEHLPVSPSQVPQGPAMRIHDRFSWGRLADIWVLDTRQHRDWQACADVEGPGARPLLHCDELVDPQRTMLGAEQEHWLADGLARSPRTWKFIAQTTQISPCGPDTPFGRVIYTDSWDGYPAARQRLLQAIAEPRVSNVVCLGGDVHRHVAAPLRLVAEDRGSPVIASEIVCSSLTSRGLSELQSAWIRRSNPDLLHARGDERGYVLFDVTPQQTECEFRATATPVAANARIHTQARFAIEAGRPGPQRS